MAERTIDKLKPALAELRQAGLEVAEATERMAGKMKRVTALIQAVRPEEKAAVLKLLQREKILECGLPQHLSN